jgi:hypothetical protein
MANYSYQSSSSSLGGPSGSSFESSSFGAGVGAGGAYGGASGSGYESSSFESSSSNFGGAGGFDASFGGASAGGFDGAGASSFESSSFSSGAGFGGDASANFQSSGSSSNTQVQQYATDAQGLFQDPNPQIIRRPAAGGVQTYTQNIKVRFLQPPPMPPPGVSP